MRLLLYTSIGILLLAVLMQGIAAVGAWVLHGHQRYEDEIVWLERIGPFIPWERGLHSRLDALRCEAVRRELTAGRLDGAVQALRRARAGIKGRGTKPTAELTAVGIETYTRAADHVEKLGRLSAAADWDDSLFVFAIRADKPQHRYAALAAFVEGLDLRVRDGKPCAALARINWAKEGLGGEVPGLQQSIEEDLTVQCSQSRRRGRG